MIIEQRISITIRNRSIAPFIIVITIIMTIVVTTITIPIPVPGLVTTTNY